MADIRGAANKLNGVAELLTTLSGEKGEALEEAKQRVAGAQQSLIEAQSALLQLQDDYRQLAEEKAELEKRLASLEASELVKLAAGAFVYVDKGNEDAKTGGPWYCQPCLEAGKRSVLTFKKSDNAYNNYACPVCSTTIRLPHHRPPPMPIAGGGRSTSLDDLS